MAKGKEVNLETEAQKSVAETENPSPKNFSRLKVVAGLFTFFGLALFVYFIYSVGVDNILTGIGRIGFDGFALILALYFARMIVRAAAWKYSVNKPYSLTLRDTISAVIIGEALSSLIPLGILISGTAKAVAVKNKIPLVAGLSSVATENLFYSLFTGLFIVFGGFAFLQRFDLDWSWTLTLDALIALVLLLIFLGILMVVRRWHIASDICERLYRKGIGKKFLEKGRSEVRRFEDLIYGFYREYPRRFVPIVLCQLAFHAIGVYEVWFVLNRLSDSNSVLYTAFLLESISRIILIVFKLVPFVVGVDEASAQFVTDTLEIGAGVGVTLAIIRKGRIIFWTAIGLILILRRGISFREITDFSGAAKDSAEINSNAVV